MEQNNTFHYEKPLGVNFYLFLSAANGWGT